MPLNHGDGIMQAVAGGHDHGWRSAEWQITCHEIPRGQRVTQHSLGQLFLHSTPGGQVPWRQVGSILHPHSAEHANPSRHTAAMLGVVSALTAGECYKPLPATDVDGQVGICHLGHQCARCTHGARLRGWV
jgi:hypothetical protein